MKHQMFASGEAGVPGQDGTTMGVLYSVNFMPGNVEIPITVKWLSPDNRVVGTQSASTRYLRRQVASYTFPADKEESFLGTWFVEFYYKDKKIGGQEIDVLSPEHYEARLKRWNGG